MAVVSILQLATRWCLLRVKNETKKKPRKQHSTTEKLSKNNNLKGCFNEEISIEL